MKRLKTTVEVIEFLGGDDEVARLFKPEPAEGDRKKVANWRYFGIFPANTYVVLKGALHKRKTTAPDELWNMKQGASL